MRGIYRHFFVNAIVSIRSVFCSDIFSFLNYGAIAISRNRLTTVVIALFLGAASSARADVLFTAQGQLSRVNGSYAQLDGATFTLQVIFHDNYSTPSVDGYPSVSSISDSLTITKSGVTIFSGVERHDASGDHILFAPAHYGQFMLEGANGSPLYNPFIGWDLGNGRNLNLQLLSNRLNNQAELDRINNAVSHGAAYALSSSHLGATLTNTGLLYYNDPSGNSAQYNFGAGAAFSMTPVLTSASAPEPTTTAVFGIGGVAAAIAALRRRFLRQRKAG